jgi:hypothetical protein
VPLRRRTLHLCDMTTDKAPWVGMVTARARAFIGKATYSWPLSRMLPMLPSTGTKKFLSCSSPWQVLFTLCREKIFSGLS